MIAVGERVWQHGTHDQCIAVAGWHRREPEIPAVDADLDLDLAISTGDATGRSRGCSLHPTTAFRPGPRPSQSDALAQPNDGVPGDEEEGLLHANSICWREPTGLSAFGQTRNRVRRYWKNPDAKAVNERVIRCARRCGPPIGARFVRRWDPR